MSTSTAERVRQHRKAMRAAGLRPIQIWVPDIRAEGYSEECRRQSLLIAASPDDAEMVAWLEKVADVEGRE